MEIRIKYTNIEPSPAVENYARGKIALLEKFVKVFEEKSIAEKDAIYAAIEIGKTGRHHKGGKVWYAECQLNLPGKSLRVTSTHYDIRAAIDEMKDKMENLLRADKEKWQRERKRAIGKKE